MPSGNYSAMARLVDNWLAMNKSPGFSFEADNIFKTYPKAIDTTDKRNDVMEKLWYEVNKKHNLEKKGRLYIIINRILDNLDDWCDAPIDQLVDLSWPYSHQDGSIFSFTEAVKVPSGGLIVVAGVSNAGKTGLAQAFLAENCHKLQCNYFNSEPNKSMFRRRISQMEWFNPMNGDGKPAFHMFKKPPEIELKYAIADHADEINIVDWIMMAEGDFWKIDSLLEGMKLQTRGGVIIATLQKSGNKELGTGGQFSEHHADIYLTMDFNRLTVRKVKEWDHTKANPNGRMYGFDLDRGVDFVNIREIMQCTKCGGRCLVTHTNCDTCKGKGWIDKEFR
jgi:hypothetical protein